MRVIKKNIITWMKIKVKNPGRFNTERVAARMPEYRFDDRQTEALAVFLLGLKKDPVRAKYVRDMSNMERRFSQDEDQRATFF